MPDREKVIKGLEEISDYFFDIYRKEKNGYSPAQEYCNVAEEALALLKEQESLIHFLEHQREKGHWIFGETNGHGWMKCSQCCVSQDGQTSCYLFCPCCGADMTEGR